MDSAHPPRAGASIDRVVQVVRHCSTSVTMLPRLLQREHASWGCLTGCVLQQQPYGVVFQLSPTRLPASVPPVAAACRLLTCNAPLVDRVAWLLAADANTLGLKVPLHKAGAATTGCHPAAATSHTTCTTPLPTAASRHLLHERECLCWSVCKPTGCAPLPVTSWAVNALLAATCFDSEAAVHVVSTHLEAWPSST
jgi:hypothetical protein